MQVFVRSLAVSAGGLVMLMSGCVVVTKTPLSTGASSALEGKSLTYATHAMPDFAAFTAGKVTFGIIGAVAMISAGNTIVAENHVPDPSVVLRERLGAKLQSAHHMPLLVTGHGDDATSKVSELVAAHRGADYLLDIETIGWGFYYFPMDWSHYSVRYSARMRLIDLQSGRVVAESACKTSAGDGNNEKPPSKDELLANHAALLKFDGGHLVDICEKTLAQQGALI
jgi:hypothetical protein